METSISFTIEPLHIIIGITFLYLVSVLISAKILYKTLTKMHISDEVCCKTETWLNNSFCFICLFRSIFISSFWPIVLLYYIILRPIFYCIFKFIISK